jgi:hypothetical protein
VNLLSDNIDTIDKHKGTLTDASKETGVEVNMEKTKYMLLSCHQNVGQNHVIKTGNRCFEDKMWHSSDILDDNNKSEHDSGGN